MKIPFAAVLALALVVPSAAFAKSTDRTEDMHIDSGAQSGMLTGDGKTVLSQGVIITQGTLDLRSSEAEIYLKDGEPVRAVFTGKQATMKQQLDDGTWMDAVADRIDYDIKTEIITLTGNYKVTSARGTNAGQRMVYNTRSEQEPGRTAGQACREQEVMLVAKGLRKRYKQREVVKDFGLTLDAGEVVGLLGPNGAGKTTCFYMIVGLVAADAGSIVLDGRDITGDPMYTRAKQGVGYMPQEPSVFRKLTVADNIRLVLELREDLDSAGRERELSSLLDELQLGHVADQLGASLSGGERRRCEIARALAAQPRLILLDEPFAGVDPISVGEIQRIVTHLKQRGIGVLITDHNVRETLGICDRAYILAEGAVLAQGSPEAILDNADVRRVYLGDSFKL
ncbi:hypothetical protein G6F65_010142 [Rhizopus arrhizus]|nr:hypothetical protein G6F65_010142 [Rhizopus arrhizus]